MKRISMKSLFTLGILLFILWNVECLAVVKIDVTGAITETSAGTHNCNLYAVDKYDTVSHWKECSICGAEYTNAGTPEDATAWTKNGYLEVKTNSSNQRILVLKNSFIAHQYTNEYWTMGDNCSSKNKLVHICDCGYSYETENTRTHGESFLAIDRSVHVLECKLCRDMVGERENHTDENGNRLTCQNPGICKVCGTTIEGHTTRISFIYDREANVTKCYYGCESEILDGENSEIEYERIGNEFYVTIKVALKKDREYKNITYDMNSRSTYGDIEFERKPEEAIIDYANKTVTHSWQGKWVDLVTEDKDIYYVRIDAIDSNDEKWVISVAIYVSPDVTKPTFAVEQESESTTEWKKNLKMKVTGLENYGSSVTVAMKDKNTNQVVYTGKTAVNKTTKEFGMEFTPDIAANEKGKEYEIIVTDTLGNSTSQTITISKVDRIAPIVIKEGQADTTGFWSTSTTWSQTKDFMIRATDEGSNIANIKIQPINSITDNYSVDSRDTTKNPTIHSKKYQFTGNIGNYITVAVYLQDEAGNETTEYVRIYHLDTIAPTITTIVKDFQVTATITDNLSGISGYAITNSNEQPNESEWKNIDASLTASNQVLEETRIMNAGNWYYWVKDQAGNMAYSAFTIEPKLVSLGNMSVNAQYQYDGTEKTPTPVVYVDGVALIRGIDYTVSYQNNIESGMATIMVTGIGNYKGTLETQFLIYIEKTEINVTGLITESSANKHNCNDYAVDKYDETYHWKECSVCSNEYVKAGRPTDASSWTGNGKLELKMKGNSEPILVIKGSFLTHNYTNEYWLMGEESCAPYNKLVHICECGYSYQTDNTRQHEKIIEDNHEVWYRYHRYCSLCRFYFESHNCEDANGNRINCSNIGTCRICGYTYTKAKHNAETELEKVGDYYIIKCEECGKEFGKQQNYYEKIDENRYRMHIQTEANDEVKDFNIGLSLGGNSLYANYENMTYEITGKTITMSVDIVFKTFPEIPISYSFWYDFNSVRTRAQANSIKLDTTAPTLNITQTPINLQNGWTTNNKISVNGTENYCSSIRVEMKDKITNEVIYTGKTTVTESTKEYALEFIPNIAADETGKEYEITVTDTLGNSTFQTIVISKVDRIAPEIVKDTQLDTENIWSTPMTWSKLKDFKITATDEGSQIARIKFQSVNNSVTNYTFTDNYGITARDENSNPVLNIREYQFTGDVTGYVTATIYLIDEAGNESTEYLRIYHLDNTAPEIAILNELKDGKVRGEEIQVNLKDSGSGIRYFGVTKIEENETGGTSGENNTETTMPIETVETDSTRGEVLNTWYRVKNEAETNPNTTEAQNVMVTFAKQKTGNYRFWAKDLLGNVSYVDFEVKNEPIKLVVNHVFDREWYEQNSKINLDVTVNAEDYEFEKKEDIGKDLIAKLTFKDIDGKEIVLPTNILYTIDGKQIESTNSNIYYVAQTGLNEEAFSIKNQITIDMTKLETPEYFKKGIHQIAIEFYVGNLAELSELQNQIATYEMDFNIQKYQYYAIVATVKQQDGKTEMELLKIPQGENIQRIIQLDYIGDLEEPYVTIKLQKQTGTNSNQIKQYTEIENEITIQKCNSLETKQEIIAEFKNTLETGSYRFVFDLYDKYDAHKATESLEFEVK